MTVPVPDGDEDPYVWPGTTVLRNLRDIHDAKELHDVEEQLAGARAARLATTTLPGAYDADHLRRFHRFLFQDIYDWAGTFRVDNIAKDGVSFCPAPEIEARLGQVLGRLAKFGYLAGRDWDAFVISFASLYGELNAVHPFREGNGRTQRAFLRQLAAHAGYTVTWEALSRHDNEVASREYMRTGHPHALIRLLAPAIQIAF